MRTLRTKLQLAVVTLGAMAAVGAGVAAFPNDMHWGDPTPSPTISADGVTPADDGSGDGDMHW